MEVVMLKKTSAIDRLLRENPELGERRFGLPDIGKRFDREEFNPTVQKIADAINFYGFEVRDDEITVKKDIDLGGGNPLKYPPFSLSIEEMIKSLSSDNMYRYPYTEGDDRIRQVLLDYIEKEGFINTEPYKFSDVDEKGLSVHNLTFLPSTSITFNIIVNIIAKPGDVILVTGPSYGLFTIRAERAGAEVEIIPLEKEDNYLVNPSKLAAMIDDINYSLQRIYNRRKGYVPRVVAFVNANPNNPTGKVMGEKQADLLRQIGQICLERGVFIIDDLIYRDITFDGNNLAKPIATIPGMFRNTISLFGLSKSYGLASLRAGFVVADEIIIREVINRIFQNMDSSPDIVGRALAGAFNITQQREITYQKYFSQLRSEYVFRYNLLKAMVSGINSITDYNMKNLINKTFMSLVEDKNRVNLLLKGLPYVEFPKGLEPEAGFFAILDFTQLKGKTFQGKTITNERQLLEFFYKTNRLRFLIGQSISWPYEDELIGRVTFALEPNEMIKYYGLMNDSLQRLVLENDYTIRFNEERDQEQMAYIKIDGWRAAYQGIVADDYLAQFDYDVQTSRYLESFAEYAKKVFVMCDKNSSEILGYACFDDTEGENNDCELVSLYIKPDHKGCGIGTALLQHTINYLKDQGKQKMLLWCFQKNTKALAFYQKNNFVIAKEKKAKIGNAEYDEYGLTLDL